MLFKVQGAYTKVIGGKRRNDELIGFISQWFRDLPAELRSKYLASLFLEHSLSAHIDLKTEEERLQLLNLQDEYLLAKVLGALHNMSKERIPNGPKYVEVREVEKYLRDASLDLPSGVVLSIVKTLQYYGRAEDVGEGVYLWKG